MSIISIKFIKKLVDLNVTIQEIETFWNEDFNSIRENVYDYRFYEKPNMIPKFNKNRKRIIAFVDKHNNIIQEFIRCDVLYEMTNGFDVRYHWDDTYKPLLQDIRNVGKSKVLEVLEKLEQKGFDEIHFVKGKLFNKMNYEKVYKRYCSNEYEIKYYYTDGIKKYFARYYFDDFPMKIENAKIVFVIKQRVLLDSKNEVHLNTFDVDIDSINLSNDAHKMLESLPIKYVDTLTHMCEYVRTIDKTIKILQSNKKNLSKLLGEENNKGFYELELKDLENQIDKMKEKRTKVINKYISFGYQENFIESNIEYLNKMEWQSSIDVH